MTIPSPGDRVEIVSVVPTSLAVLNGQRGEVLAVIQASPEGRHTLRLRISSGTFRAMELTVTGTFKITIPKNELCRCLAYNFPHRRTPSCAPDQKA